MTLFQLWTGRILSAVAVLFLLFDITLHLLRPPFVIEGTKKIGYPVNTIFMLGIIELVCLILYLIPRTAVLGAILWTGYLGGAVATHVRLSDPLFSQILFPIYVALLLWGGLWLRDQRLRALIPIR
jgi:hypothetical protein